LADTWKHDSPTCVISNACAESRTLEYLGESKGQGKGQDWGQGKGSVRVRLRLKARFIIRVMYHL